jgi:hypothetical protein
MPGAGGKTRWKLLGALALVAGAGLVGWQAYVRSTAGAGVPANAIMVIAPYWYNGTWVFDDPTVGLKREPFVAGVPEMIDILVKNIPDAREGFRLTFSAKPFPGHQKKLTWLRGDGTGNFYRLNEPPVEGWICPAMFKYYKTPPENLYVQADPIRR